MPSVSFLVLWYVAPIHEHVCHAGQVAGKCIPGGFRFRDATNKHLHASRGEALFFVIAVFSLWAAGFVCGDDGGLCHTGTGSRCGSELDESGHAIVLANYGFAQSGRNSGKFFRADIWSVGGFLRFDCLFAVPT